MTRLFHLTNLLLLLFACQAFAQTPDSLQQKIQQIIANKNAIVGVAISGNKGKNVVSINGDRHFPMQSVFKFHIALAVLAKVDQGKLSLTQLVEIKKEDLLPNLYSPLRDKYPNGATLPMAEILEYTLSKSDNLGCELLLKLIGGPQIVEQYFMANHFKDLSIKFNEELQQANWELQFQNWTTPNAANEVLAAFYGNKKNLLSQKSYEFLWAVMMGTKTGPSRIRGQLPASAVVAHKTGSSGANKEGLTAAVNDIGVVFLPNGQYFFISVFVTNSTESYEANEHIISDIAKAAWDYFNGRRQ